VLWFHETSVLLALSFALFETLTLFKTKTHILLNLYKTLRTDRLRRDEYTGL
jgi:hypothetical protein